MVWKATYTNPDKTLPIKYFSMPCLVSKFNRFILVPILSDWLSLDSFVLLDSAICSHSDRVTFLEVLNEYAGKFEKHVVTIAACISNSSLKWLDVRNLLQFLRCIELKNSDLLMDFYDLPCMPSLRTLKIPQCSEAAVSTIKILIGKCPNLQSCDLSQCRCWTVDEILKGLANHCPLLTSIDCTDVVNLEDYSILRLLRCCPELNHVVLDGCHQLTKDTLNGIASHNIPRLSLARCNGFNSGDYCCLFQQDKCPLIEITCHHLLSPDLEVLMAHCCNEHLIKLDVSYSRLPPRFFPDGIALCTNLETFIMDYCDPVDCKFTSVIRLPKLKTAHCDGKFGECLVLLIPKMESVTDLSLLAFDEVPSDLAVCCPNLQKLKLNIEHRHFTLHQILSDLPSLTSFTLAGYSIDDREFAPYVAFMKNLRVLDLSGTWNLRRKTLDNVAHYCRQLEDFRYGQVLPNEVLEIVVNNKMLERLHAYCNCILIPDMIEFGQQLKYFGVLNNSLEDCSPESLTYFVKGMKNLKELTVYPLYRDSIDEMAIRAVNSNLMIIELPSPR